MEKKCGYKYCYAPDSPCNLGEQDFTDCPHWKEAVVKDESAEVVAGSGLLPWSGNSLGTIDVEIVTGRSNPKIIGVIGAHDAGKTTLLTVFYLMLTHGWSPEGRSFAGSLTFGGWENLASFLRWKDGHTPRFPPHTGSYSGRLPGLLHIAFRNDSSSLEEFLFTDAPGEWFDQWATNKTASRIEGAQWVSRFADSFMLFVDSKALSGPNRGQARAQLFTLAERLADETNGRPVAIVWAKSDIEVPKEITSALKEKFRKLFKDYREFSLSVHTEDRCRRGSQDPFMELLNWLLSLESPRVPAIPELEVTQKKDPLLAFRGK